MVDKKVGFDAGRSRPARGMSFGFLGLLVVCVVSGQVASVAVFGFPPRAALWQLIAVNVGTIVLLGACFYWMYAASLLSKKKNIAQRIGSPDVYLAATTVELREGLCEIFGAAEVNRRLKRRAVVFVSFSSEALRFYVGKPDRPADIFSVGRENVRSIRVSDSHTRGHYAPTLVFDVVGDSGRSMPLSIGFYGLSPLGLVTRKRAWLQKEAQQLTENWLANPEKIQDAGRI